MLLLGDVMVDVVAALSGPLAPGSDAPGAVSLRAGGSAANTAAWLASLGVPVVLAGRVGDDVLGRASSDELRRAGVELDLTVDPGRPTGTCVVLVGADGERTMVPDAGANDALSAPSVAAGDVHVSGYALLRSGSREAALAALAAARARGAGVSVDAASAAPLRTVGTAAFADWVGRALLFANRDEAEVLTGLPDAEAAAVALGRRHGAAVVKSGAAGAVWSDGVRVETAAARAVQVVDSTGAGDAFAAGFLAGALAGGDPAEALAAGCALAATAVTRLGARPGGGLLH